MCFLYFLCPIESSGPPFLSTQEGLYTQRAQLEGERLDMGLQPSTLMIFKFIRFPIVDKSHKTIIHPRLFNNNPPTPANSK